jgi:hypothetical protein
MEKLYKCSYSCKHYFGDKEILAKSTKDAKIGLKIKIENNHINKSAETIRDCGKCKLKIKLK